MNDKPTVPQRVVRCPGCRKSVRYDETNPFRPFCSALCKNEDIVGWAEETFRIPGEPGGPNKDDEDDEEG